MDYKHLQKKFISKNPGLLHFSSHSHHFWPDVTYDAQIEQWNDSSELIDDKWDKMYGEKMENCQRLIAEVLEYDYPERITFASNTHELAFRLLSCLDLTKPINILTTDAEFHSFRRQSERLYEMENVSVTRVPLYPFDTFESRFIAASQEKSYQFVYFSHVFFNSGFCIQNLERLVEGLKVEKEGIICVDGYHSFMAVPVSLRKVQGRLFQLGGAQKQAQGGEGCCFMLAPKDTKHLRPLYTGWMAEYSSLNKEKSAILDKKKITIAYEDNWARFASSTMDQTAMQRLSAVLELWKREGITVQKSHAYVQNLQQQFLKKLEEINHPHLNSKSLQMYDIHNHGHFLTFKMAETDSAHIYKALKENHVWTDVRGTIIRFGFAVYISTEDVDKMVSIIKEKV